MTDPTPAEMVSIASKEILDILEALYNQLRLMEEEPSIPDPPVDPPEEPDPVPVLPIISGLRVVTSQTTAQVRFNTDVPTNALYVLTGPVNASHMGAGYPSTMNTWLEHGHTFTKLQPDGEYTLTIHVIDKAGGFAETTIPFRTLAGDVVVLPPEPPVKPPQEYFDFFKVIDVLYPPIPSINSTNVFEAHNHSELHSLLTRHSGKIPNLTIVMNDANYQPGSRRYALGSNIKDTTLISRYRGGARWTLPDYNDDNMFIAGTQDLTLIGQAYSKGKYYALRCGGNAKSYPNDPSGANKRLKVLFSTISNMAHGGFKVDNGETVKFGITEDVEFGYCMISDLAQRSGFAGFNEGGYVGSGTDAYTNRVDGMHLHHCLFDGTNMPAGHGSEAFEIKVFCSNVLMEHLLVKNWLVTDSTSGGAIAISINSGTNIGPMPTSGDIGYVLRDSRITGTRRGGRYRKGNGVVWGHGGVMERVVIDNNDDSAVMFMQKNTADSGIFSNPAEVDLLLQDNLYVNNIGGDFYVDFLNVPAKNYARITSRRNRTNKSRVGSYYPVSGINWIEMNDQFNVDPREALAPYGG